MITSSLSLNKYAQRPKGVIKQTTTVQFKTFNINKTKKKRKGKQLLYGHSKRKRQQICIHIAS